jgi:hypothetical protein
MTRSLQTDPPSIRAARRTNAPRRSRKAEPAVVRREARLLRAVGIEPRDEPATGDRPASIRIRVTAARPGFHHPLGRREIRELLDFFGPVTTYGVRSIELTHLPTDDRTSVRLASLRVPGVVLVYEQAESPWVVHGRMSEAAVHQLERAGAVLSTMDSATRIAWPGETLADCMRFDGLLHEIGHHLIQHHNGKRTARVMRTADHERRAKRFADACRRAWVEKAGPG